MLKKSMCYSIIAIACAGFIVLGIGFYQAIIVTTMLSPQPSSEAPTTRLNCSSWETLSLKEQEMKRRKGLNNTPKEILVDNAGIDGLESKARTRCSALIPEILVLLCT